MTEEPTVEPKPPPPKPGTARARASSKDILGRRRPPAERIDPHLKDQYHTLIEWRDRLINRRGELVRDASEEPPGYSLHMADAGTDQFDRDFALSMASSEQSVLYEIEQAINRIRGGSYGICELTGKPIEAERLKAIPWTRFSTEAEKQLEKEGVVRRARFGALETMPKATETEENREEAEEEES